MVLEPESWVGIRGREIFQNLEPESLCIEPLTGYQ